jgi:tetratricopeptide (TPR) repeat protein
MISASLRRARVLVALSFAGLAGCSRDALSPASPNDVPQGAQPKTPTQTVEPIVVRAYSTDELLMELERARSLLLVEKFEEASDALDRLRAQATDPAIVAAAAYHAGLAFEGLGNRQTAFERFRLVAESFGEQAIARNALVRMTRLLGRFERWAELGATADRLLARADLPVMDQLEARGAKALALVETGDVDGASVYAGKAIALIDEHGFGRSGQPPVQVAQVSFAEGEIRRLRSEAIKLLPVSPQFGERLEARCQALLDAQSSYSDAMRARDGHWSAMSGFRVGQLYTDLHAEAMTIPPPEKAKTLKQKQLFEGALRLRYRILLEKGLKMMDATVRLGDRTGEDSEWVGRARESKRALEQALADEKRALSKLPYTEDELKKGLESLKARATEGNKDAKPSEAKPAGS